MLRIAFAALLIALTIVQPSRAEEARGAKSQDVPMAFGIAPKERCATAEGRRLIKESFDAPTLYDIRMQAEAQGVDFVTYLDDRVEQLCNPKGGWVGSFVEPDEMVYFWTGPKQPELLWSSYGEDIDERGEFRAPDGWQVCRFTYDVGYRRKSHVQFDIQPDFWWEGDDENPDRFRGYRTHMKLHGDPGNPTNLVLRNVQMIVIKSSFKNDERFRRGCDMPDRNSGPKVPPKPKPDTATQQPTGPAVIKAKLFENGNVAELIVRNEGLSPGTLTYLVRVKDETGQWKVAGEGSVNVPPGQEARVPFHAWRAIDWDLQSL